MNPYTKATLIKVARILTDLPVLPFGVLLIILATPVALCQRGINFLRRNTAKPRLLWGASPIISLAYMSKSLQLLGYKSHCAVLEASSIYPRETFTYNLHCDTGCGKIVNWITNHFISYLFFARALLSYDIFHYYFDGGILRRSLLNRFELTILKLIGKKVVLFPYGSDAFVYDTITNPLWRHALLTHYPMHGNHAAKVQKSIRRMTARADTVIACLVHFCNLPRWDILPLTVYPVDTQKIQTVLPRTEGVIRIAHTTNHRGVKGTEFLIDAVARLKKDGHDIELDIIEKVPNDEALERIAKADIFVDQLIFAYAQAALEGMASGKVVISPLEQSLEYDLFRQYSYLNECPIIPANAQTIYTVLTQLIIKRDTWPELGQRNREFVCRRHSFAACGEMFQAIYDHIWYHKPEIDLIHFYHPLLQKKQEHSTDEL